MRKFLETYPTVQFDELYKVYPDYGVMLSEIVDVGKKVKRGVSIEAEEQYEQLLDSFDAFLLTDESIDLYNEAYPRRALDKSLLPSVKESLSLEERDTLETELEEEIEGLMKGIDSPLIENIAPVKAKEEIIAGEEQVSRTKEDFDEDERFVGISVKYSDIDKVKFEKTLSMLGQGCKFSYATFGSKSFVLFKLKGMGRLIIQTSETRKNYERIFFPPNQPLNLFVLNDNQYTLQNIFNLFEESFEWAEDSNEVLDDNFLYNTPYIYGSYETGFLWKEAELVQQPKGIALRSNLIETYFSLYNPLEAICTMQMCYEIHTKVNVDSDAKSKIEKNIEEQSYYIEGFKINIKPTLNILKELQDKSLLDSDYKLTPLGRGAMDYNIGNRTIMPIFRPFAYYMNDLQKKVSTSPNKYYSIFNGQTLYHIQKEADKIEFAIALTTPLKKLWNVQDAIESNSYPIKWQQNQDFKNYVQYLPCGAGGKMSIRKMKEAREQRKSTQGKIVFRDLTRKYLYIASVENNDFVWSIDAQNYKYITKMFAQDNLRILGNNESSYSAPDFAFFIIVNDENNILAVLQAQYRVKETTEVEVDNAGKSLQEKIKFNKSYETISAQEQPLPVWDVNSIMNKLEEKYPKFVEEGKMLDGTEDVVVEDEAEVVENKKKNDVIIDFDNPQEPLVEVEDEKTILLKELNEELLFLQELEQDDIIEQEIKELKEKIEALK